MPRGNGPWTAPERSCRRSYANRDRACVARSLLASSFRRACQCCHASSARPTLESGDLADLQPVLRGEKTLEQLRAEGVNTEVIKKFKVRSRVIKVGDGQTEQQIERELELHDLSGSDFDRIVNTTDGFPTKKLQLSGDTDPSRTAD